MHMTTLNSNFHNQKRHPCLYNAEMCQKCSRDFPDSSGLHSPSGLMLVQTYQANHSCPCYISRLTVVSRAAK